MATQTVYSAQSSSSKPRPSFPVHSFPQSSGSATAPTTSSAFKAPAHKHAHHLHSIPPREKSTRTLIIDHMLWLHARTRLQQARAELGMTVSIPDESEPNSTIEKNTEDPELLSDGEDLSKLKFRTVDQPPDGRFAEEDEYMSNQNVTVAHTLRLRADGFEKVLTAMLDQPPEVQPPYSDEDAPRTPPAIHGSGEHHFPNGVRLRLALGTLINDLFARDIPTPLSATSSNTPASKLRSSATPSMSPLTSRSALPPPALSLDRDAEMESDVDPKNLPPSLILLSSVSNYTLGTVRDIDSILNPPSDEDNNILPSFSAFARGSAGTAEDLLPPIHSLSSSSDDSRLPSVATYPSTTSSRSDTVASPSGTRNPSQSTRATGRALQLWKAGIEISSANSPPSLRCPRHLIHSCVICAAVRNPTILPGPHSGSSHRAGSTSPVITRGSITLGSNGSKTKTAGIGASHGLVSWKTGAGIGGGLARPGVKGTALLRRTVSQSTAHPNAKDSGPCAVGGKLSDLIPRFLRLSAWVAVELGMEAQDREEEREVGNITSDPASNEKEKAGDEGLASPEQRTDERQQSKIRKASVSTASPPFQPYKGPTSIPPESFTVSFRPTREWYAILAGLLTRAVLEGYLSQGWKGPQAMECLLGVGVGVDFNSGSMTGPEKRADGSKAGTEDDEFDCIDPDDFPSLFDAAVILFPSSGESGNVASAEREDRSSSSAANVDYEDEMIDRLREFLAVHANAPDLTTHLEDLAYKFPAEPVERAAVRFCEAVARWRGKPELENYRKKPSGNKSNTVPMQVDTVDQSRGSSVQNPAKTPIERYFSPPPSATSLLPRNKRRRLTVDEGRERELASSGMGSKKVNFNVTTPQYGDYMS